MHQVEGLLFIDEAGCALQGSRLPSHTGMSCDAGVLGQQQQKLFPQLLQEDTCALWHASKLIPASRPGKVSICVLKIRLDKEQSYCLVRLASKSKPD